MSLSFRGALVVAGLTAFSVTFLTALAENDAARARNSDTVKTRPIARPAAEARPMWPFDGAVRVIDLGRGPAKSEPASRPVRSVSTRRGAGAA